MVLAQLDAISPVMLGEQRRLQAWENNSLEDYTRFGGLYNKM